MLSFVSWQDDSSAETDDEEEWVSQRLQHDLLLSLIVFAIFTLLRKVLRLNRKTQLMERNALNQKHVTQRYASPYHIWQSFTRRG